MNIYNVIERTERAYQSELEQSIQQPTEEVIEA